MKDLEAQFDRAMFSIYDRAKRECKYNASYFLQMLVDHGGLKTAKRLLAKDDLSDGFTTLWEHGRLDLTVEAHVIQPRFAELFTAEEIEKAGSRLKQYGYRGAL